MAKKKTTRDLVKQAAEAHSDLTVFASIVAILEGGTVSANAQPDDFKIIRICHAAQQKALHRYDRACDALGAPYVGRSPYSSEQREVK